MTSRGEMGRPSLYICHVEMSVTSTSGANCTHTACRHTPGPSGWLPASCLSQLGQCVSALSQRCYLCMTEAAVCLVCLLRPARATMASTPQDLLGRVTPPTSGNLVGVLLTQMTSYCNISLSSSDLMSSHTSSGAPACLTAQLGRRHLAYMWKLSLPCTGNENSGCAETQSSQQLQSQPTEYHC